MADLDNLLALVPVAVTAKIDLRARLAAPDRHYHGTAHVVLLWQRHLLHGTGRAVRAEPWNTWLACAIAFHDAIYDSTRCDNEAASAALWRASTPALPEDAIAWVAGTIQATANHLAAQPEPGMAAAAWAARVWMLDLDLSPLGETAAYFDSNTAALRLEYGHLSDGAWASGRTAFLRAVATLPRLFRTDVLYDAFEAPARANFARELGRN